MNGESQILTALSQLRGHTPSTLEHCQIKAESVKGHLTHLSTKSSRSSALCLNFHPSSADGGSGSEPEPTQPGLPGLTSKLNFLELTDERKHEVTHVCVAGLEDKEPKVRRLTSTTEEESFHLQPSSGRITAQNVK